MLVGTAVVRLSALAVVVLDACERWTDPVDLTGLLVARFGPPEGDAEAATWSLLSQLAGEGLLEMQSPTRG